MNIKKTRPISASLLTAQRACYRTYGLLTDAIYALSWASDSKQTTRCLTHSEDSELLPEGRLLLCLASDAAPHQHHPQASHPEGQPAACHMQTHSLAAVSKACSVLCEHGRTTMLSRDHTNRAAHNALACRA